MIPELPPIPIRPGGRFCERYGNKLYRTPHLLHSERTTTCPFCAKDFQTWGLSGVQEQWLDVEAICIGAWGAAPANSVDRTRLWTMGAEALAEWEQIGNFDATEPEDRGEAFGAVASWSTWLREVEALP